MLVDITTHRQFLFMFKRSKKVVLIFYREGNHDSRDVIRHIIKLAKMEQYIEITFLTIDFDIFDEITDLFDVDKPPTTVYVHNKVAERVAYDNNLGLIEDYLDELVMSK
jgi:hypothetical protein